MRDDYRLPVEVEPLPEARVAKVRQHVLAAVDAEARTRVTVTNEARGRRGRLVAAVTLAAAAAVAGIAGRAFLERQTSADARLVTTESASQFTIGESSLDVAPRSTVLVHGDDAHGVDVVLDRGGVTCEVAPRRGRPAFVVDAGEVRVRVVGTRFTVQREGSTAGVHVDHGAVEVTSRGAVTMLHDGESWPSAPVAAASPTAPPSLVAPVAPVAEAVAPVPVASSRSLRKHGGRHALPAPSEPTPASAPDGTAVTTAPVAAAALPAASPREQFEAAAKLEASQPTRAADLYRSLADGGSGWAPNGLFALARLQVDRGQAVEAKQLLRGYLARYPHGQNAEDARTLLERLP